MDDIIIYCEREGYDMGKKNKRGKRDLSEQASTDESASEDTEGSKEDEDTDKDEEKPELKVALKERCFNFFAKIPYKWAIVTFIVGVPTIFTIGIKYNSFTTTLDGLQSGIAEIQSDMKEIQSDMKNMQIERAGDKLELFSDVKKQIDRRFADIEDDVKKLDDEVADIKTVNFNDAALSCMAVQLNVKGMYEATEPNWKSEEIIAVDPVTNETFSASELANQRILVPYELEGQEILFCGQYNKKNHWDGKCIINVYVNDILSVITEAVYNDGELIKYKQVIPAVNGSSRSTWVVSDRIHSEDFNSGNSWSYVRDGSFGQKFELADATPDDVLTVNQFKKQKCKILEGFYHGNTSKGQFNDDTGNAYLVKYDLWGYVRTLYVGRIQDGDFEDMTGNAWYIVRDDDTDYIYYRGIFQNGNPDYSDPDKFINPFSLNEIYNIVKQYEFECDLPWYNPNKLKI